MKISDLKIGMLLDARFREYDYDENMRVEFVAADWAVARTDRGVPVFLDENSNLELYKGDIK
ncbi:MAG: hypothetical protein WC346_05500 [Methanogenium sp.]|jgi:hypothetical protein